MTDVPKQASQAHSPLDYASPAPDSYDWEQGKYLLSAFICGIAPMAVGTIALVGYALT